MGYQAQPFVYVICLSDTSKDGSVSQRKQLQYFMCEARSVIS